jgi:hypothetical protein
MAGYAQLVLWGVAQDQVILGFQKACSNSSSARTSWCCFFVLLRYWVVVGAAAVARHSAELCSCGWASICMVDCIDCSCLAHYALCCEMRQKAVHCQARPSNIVCVAFDSPQSSKASNRAHRIEFAVGSQAQQASAQRHFREHCCRMHSHRRTWI